MTKEKLPLNVLLSKKCNADCGFCIEKTKINTPDTQSWQDFAHSINQLIDRGLVQDVLLLGGEPLYYRGLIDLVRALKLPPIITTNAHRLIHDRRFLVEFSALNIKALNISLAHYDEVKRAKVMGRFLFTNEALGNALRTLQFNKRVNTTLIQGYIDNLNEIKKMAHLCREIEIPELKVAELTGINPDIHDFVSPEVIAFNRTHYVPIPDVEVHDMCHQQGGTYFWRTIAGVAVYFNAPPDKAMTGGKNLDGSHYHRVLFNDGLIGNSWRRDDGLERPT